jgi:hypothetical protein
MSGPEVWGPHGWKFIHYVTLAYPVYPTDEQKEKYKAFFTLLSDILPCPTCGKHYKEHLLLIPLTDTVLSCRENLVNWAIDMHNMVNASKDKEILDYAKARELIGKDTVCTVDTFTNTNTPLKPIVLQETKTNNGLYYLIFIVFTLIGIAIIYKKKK